MARRLHQEKVFPNELLNQMRQPLDDFVADVKTGMLLEAAEHLQRDCDVKLRWKIQGIVACGLHDHRETRVLDDLSDRMRAEGLRITLDGLVE